MDPTNKPWTDLQVLHNLAAHWRQRWLNRTVFRVSVGPDWLRLHWAGEERDGLILSSRHGSHYAFEVQGTWPDAVRQALPLAKGHLLAQQLTEAKLLGLGVLPEDRVWALHFETVKGEKLTLMHQVFGPRGNTTLLDRQLQLLWSRHKMPHSLLTSRPPRATWSGGEAQALSQEARPLSHTMEELFLQRLAFDIFHRYESAITRSLAASDRLIKNLNRDWKNANRGEEFRRTAEALAAHLHTLKQGQDVANIFDLQDGSPLSVPLDPALSPSVNMENWFRKARKADKGLDVITDNLGRARGVRDQQAEADQEIRKIGALDDALEILAALHPWVAKHENLLPKARTPGTQKAHSPDEPVRPFRRYLIDGKWEAWVGRNNKENDVLTHRASHTQDIWMHAQGVSGSHVILRTNGKPEQVPRSVLEKAASLAALHCKAKHSALVPVIYTQRRYVRKPRKAPVGTAVCLQEKNIFVEPGIASGVDPI